MPEANSAGAYLLEGSAEVAAVAPAVVAGASAPTDAVARIFVVLASIAGYQVGLWALPSVIAH